METLVKIVKCIDGFENWYLHSVTGAIRVDFVPKPHRKVLQ